MRIRKRAVPLPLSLLSPVTFSEPHLHLVQLSHSQPSDHPPSPPPHDLRRLICQDHDNAVASPPQRPMELKGYEDEKSKEQGEKGDDTRKERISGAASDHVILCGGDGRWCEDDRAMPLKKRKASFEMNGVVVTGQAKMEYVTKKILHNTSEEEEEKDDNDDDSDEEERNDNKKKKKKKKSKKSRSIMEGSRCSRVNGRGWRCMQPTLVGYSLCEHHLGKGRLRSMSSVRGPAVSDEKTSNGIQEDSYHVHDEKNRVSRVAGEGNKKKMKLGVVKARSLSSLLCQPNTAIKQHEI